MPRIAILADIHSNVHALKAVLASFDSLKPDMVVHAGDVVGYAAYPGECVHILRRAEIKGVMGNHDLWALRVRDALKKGEITEDMLTDPVSAGFRQAATALDDEEVDWLDALPLGIRIPGALLSHASLHDRADWPYLEDEKAARPTLDILSDTQEKLGFFGHTHCVAVFSANDLGPLPEKVADDRCYIPEGAVCAVTVGSVGQSREKDLRAIFVIWDSEERIVEVHRVEYPRDQAAAAILEAGLPEYSAERLLRR